jgi:hypothetical protein
MARMTVGQLIEELKDVDKDFIVVFQGNENEEGYTTCIGYVYSGFARDKEREFVVDCVITNHEY